jgi:hypothetical protein
VIAVVASSIFCSLIQITGVQLFELTTANRKLDFSTRLLASTLDNGLLIVPWLLIYYSYHYVEKSRRQQVGTLKLEALVKELELKTIKSHINPHFILMRLTVFGID